MRNIVLAVFLALASTSLYAQKEPSISHLPTSVQNGIREWKGDGQVKSIKTHEQANGSNHYEVLYKERGNEKSVIFAEDGSVISEADGKGGGKGKGKEKQKEKNKGKTKNKDNKADQGDKDEATEGKDDDNNRPVTSSTTRPTPPTPTATTPPARPTVNRPVARPEATTQPTQPASTEPVTRPNTSTTSTRPAARPETVTRPNTSTLPGGVRWTGSQVRYVYWDNLPEPIRTAAKAQEAQHGSVNTRALRQQTSGANSMYHIPYERASVAFSPTGSVAIPAANAGGPMRLTNWDSVPEAVRKSTESVAATEGGRNTRTVFSQAERGKTLYHIIFEGKNTVIAFSQDGARQEPASFWR